MEGKIVNKDFRIVKKLGSGAFGEVYKALNIKNHIEVAVKLEPIATKSPQLLYEAKIIAMLSGDGSVDHGIPQFIHSGVEGEYNMMIMELCGQSLEDIFTNCQRVFDLKTVLMLAHDMLERVEHMHKTGFIHRDIKPDNFVVGYGRKTNKVYLIDFGLAKKYQVKGGSHIPYKDNKNLTGTARFASLNTHLGIEQGRRDDIEGVANVLLYFFKGSVPWQNLKAANKKEKYERIMEKKLSIPLAKLCENLPEEMLQLFTHCRTLEFEDQPNYSLLKQLMLNAMEREEFDFDHKFCWVD